MQIVESAPQLRITDLERAIRFYTEKLGFVLAFRHQDFYAGVRCGEAMIHLKLVDDPDPGIDFVRSGQHLHVYLARGTSMPPSARFRKLARRSSKALPTVLGERPSS